MAKSKEIRARVDAIFAAKVEAWSRVRGFETVSDYLRFVLEVDMLNGGKADALAVLNAEQSLINSFIVYRLLKDSSSTEDAKKFEEWAKERAASIVDDRLRHERG